MSAMILEKINSFIFDFDSTVMSVEVLDSIIKDSVQDESVKKQTDRITAAAMDGKLDFYSSITARLSAANLTQKNFDDYVADITTRITPGMEEVIELLLRSDQKVFILSAGFLNTIFPVAEKLNIPKENCFANSYVLNERNEIVGLGESPLIYESGKNKIIRELKSKNVLPGKVIMIGDGMSDCRTYLDGDADYFIGCGFNAERENVKKKSPIFVSSVGELLAILRDALSSVVTQTHACLSGNAAARHSH
jgi:D-3-phosphoglycerate dehydrogenase